jgi:hypothetical protein
VIGFAQIAGGAPSSVQAMTRHLLNNTVSQEEARLAAYYGRGMIRDDLRDIAGQVAEGRVAYADALSQLVQDHLARGGSPELADTAEARLGKRLDDLVHRIRENLEDAPVAVIRSDLHPVAARGLGIDDPRGLLSPEQINALLAGRRADGAPIAGKNYARERRLPVDPKTGEQRYSGPIGSYDFCPTPDKSVSVAWAFAPPTERARVLHAHHEAAREAMAYIAAEIGRARLGKAGQDGVEPGHVAWLEFTHHTARRTAVTVQDGAIRIDPDRSSPGDPDLHTHFLIPNAVFCDSGRVGSLDTAAIGGFIFEADAVYQALLGQKLRDAGFAVELDPATGAARMPVIPDSVRTLFSKRSAAGEALARKATADREEDWDNLSPAQQDARLKMATQSLDQKVKGGKDDVADFAAWQRQAAALGWGVPRTFLAYGPWVPEPAQEQRLRRAYDVALPFLAERLEHRSVVTHWDVRVAAARGLVDAGMAAIGDVGAVTALMRQEGVAQYGEQTALVWGAEPGRRYTSVTTALHETQEEEFIRLARAANADPGAPIPDGLLHRKIAESGLTFGGTHGTALRAAIERLGQGGRFELLIAAAGAGKSAALSPLVAAWQEMGCRIYGASLAWRQADDMVNAGIDQRDLKAFSVFIDAVRDGSLRLNHDAVVAVDEWGLLGTRQALELLRLQERHGFKVVALGDDKQCQAIEAGAIIDLSRRALGADRVPVIPTTLRQRTECERQIVGLFRDGRAAEALDMKRADGTAEMAPGGYDGVAARVAQLYRERLVATGEAPAISAPTNTDAHRIAEGVRAERRALGMLGPDLRVVRATDGERDYALRLARGDQVRLFSSTGARFGDGKGGTIGRNGSVLEVIDADEHGITLRARTGKVGTVRWGDVRQQHGRMQLAYGYAMTIHTAQGSTATEHIFALPSGSKAIDGLSGYTANTRHRHAGYIVTNESAEQIEVRKRRPLNDLRPVTIEDRWANVARAMSFQPEPDSATALRERALRFRRGAVRGFQRSLPADPLRQANRKHETAGPRAVERKRQRLILGQVRAAMSETVRRISRRVLGRAPHAGVGHL